MRLDVPDYEQGLNECGPNALRMVYEYYGMSGAFDIHDNYIPGSSNLMLVIAPENSTQAGYVPETKLDEDTTTTNLLESLNDIVYGAAETYWPFDTNGDFIGVDDWMNNIWDGHADGLGGFTILPLQGAASALDDVGGWIGGDVGDFMQGIANDISEAGYNLQDTMGTFIQDPIGTAEEFVSDTMDEVENLVSDPIGTISSWF